MHKFPTRNVSSLSRHMIETFQNPQFTDREMNADHGNPPGEGPWQSRDCRIFEDTPILLSLALHPLHKQDCQEERPATSLE